MMILDRTEPVTFRETLRSRHLTRLTGLVPIEWIDDIGDAIFSQVTASMTPDTSMLDFESQYAEFAGIVLKSHGIPA